ncbi:S-adenosyl-L-methionine-dependent methyltransferase [Metschnikowia bicuspidata var. bicuspidata NRRL YB-4993]|uniref:tRNA (uracil(54)-C(5))-methyltransferase n=1 Tax=Metschnikowia bicuspidata var. bicuspidata NRRL YB-4993 TaxID=869754 RepID=A0A1A0HJT0_9ASCO|nr:S-adenosyl-L-methionine-dependent methyltransferase [Metschnikowia bicuspidata var. bicuspidata NRRL YB-4993]OBA24275.1 S-adenosyl-L-methionine-dependent methyltransferase [Metschnikowia bicuspidata var. bicuspidata NRRL YB-4993]
MTTEAHVPGPKKYKRKYKSKDVDPTSPMGVLQHEIKEILRDHNLSEEDIQNDLKELLNDVSVEQMYHRNVSDVEVLRLSSNGDGLALIPHPANADKKQIVVVPFAFPGDVVSIRVFKSHPLYVESDLLRVTKSSNNRKDELINCKYFGKCSGCQYQNIDYDTQLEFKRQTIVNAYRYFAPRLFSGELPEVEKTQSSPLKYDYRTKLTPHFNVPNRIPQDYKRPSVGFGSKGRPEWRENVQGGDQLILDIEECSIGTPIVNQGMANERSRFLGDFRKYKKGATILLRENTLFPDANGEFEPKSGSTNPENEISKLEVEVGDKKLLKTCVTESRTIVTEYVNGYTFEFSAGEFFQNNNLILPIVTEYVKNNLQIPGSGAEDQNYLVDAYCGSGLFSITCLTGVSRVIGVEVSADSVKFAERNAKKNKVENASFIVGKAEEIFKNIDTPAERTSVILDPPRKGCDEVFLNQLSAYHPAKIVYISCNVHSQARDIEWFINNTETGKDYKVESVRGFDFFPQTHHVESVAVLTLK